MTFHQGRDEAASEAISGKVVGRRHGACGCFSNLERHVVDLHEIGHFRNPPILHK